MEKGIKSPAGKDRWYSNTVQSILTIEKMKGDALLQKKFTVDFLTKKVKKNEGEIPQYYVTGNHEAIIPPATFDLVQAEIERRSSSRGEAGTAGPPYSPIASSVGRVVIGSVPRFGTAMINTGG